MYTHTIEKKQNGKWQEIAAPEFEHSNGKNLDLIPHMTGPGSYRVTVENIETFQTLDCVFFELSEHVATIFRDTEKKAHGFFLRKIRERQAT